MTVYVCCTELYLLTIYWYRILSHSLYFIYVFKVFYEQPGYFCHPNTNMTSTDLKDAMRECHADESCNAFYKVCSYERYRKCNDTAYEEDSECGLVGNKSFLYIKGI